MANSEDFKSILELYNQESKTSGVSIVLRMIKDVFTKYNQSNLKNFDYDDIVIDLNSVDDSEKSKSEFAFEQLAFRLQPQHGDNPWGHYHYGPQFTFGDANGLPVYSPAIDDITSESVVYWKGRLADCVNPLLKLRYATLVWDFQPSICRQSNDGVLYRTIVDAALEVCNGDYLRYPVLTVNTLEYLFAFVNKKSEDLTKVKDAYKEFELHHSEDNAVRYWSSRFQLMLSCKKCFTDEEQSELIAEHEARLVRLATPNLDGKINPWTVQSQACLLADYYVSKSQKEEVKRVLGVIEVSFHHEEANMMKLQYAGNLENVQRLYRHYNWDSEASRMMVDVQNAYARAMDEMQPQKFEFEIPKEVFEQAEVMFGKKAKDDSERWTNFAFYFIPNREKEEVCLKESAKKFPFRFMMGNHLLDTKGRPMSAIRDLESDFEGNLALHIVEKMRLNVHFLEMAIHNMLDCDAITIDKLMDNLIIPCPIFEENRYDIICEALQFFMDGKYILFAHLIVPQLENAICTLVEKSGMSVLRPQKSGNGFQLKTLDDLLRMQPVKDALTDDGAYYLRLVLTNQIGLNIRNLMCHGIADPQYFGYGCAGRLLHVLFVLGMVREKKE